MKVTIGIDIGGSTTKIVGVQNRVIVNTLKVKADDPLTSAYGAFGKYLNTNNMTLSDIERIFVTGVGASFLTDSLYGLPTEKISEFLAIGYGGEYLSGFDRAIIVSMGTGTAFVKVSGDTVIHLGGTGVGGGTLLGLSNRLLNIRHIDNLIDLAAEGNLDNVDLTIGDISKNAIPNMTMDTTASNFGKLSDVATGADVAMGLMNLVFQTIGMMAYFAARSDGIKNIVMTGNLTIIPMAKSVLKKLETLYDINFVIPNRSDYATALGAALYGSKKN